MVATLVTAGIVGATTIGTNISTDGNLTVDTNTLFVDSDNNYVGIGTTTPAYKLDVYGNARITATSTFDGIATFNSGIELGTIDDYDRQQIWNYLPSSVLRLGSWVSDGDASSIATEGIIVYGKNTDGDDMAAGTGGYARVKSNRFGLYSQTIAGLDDYYHRVNDSTLYFKKDDAEKSFEVTRSTGNLMTLGTIGIGSTTPSAMLGIGSSVSATSTVDFGKMCWRVTAPDASTQVYIYYNGTTGALATTTVSCY